MSKERYAAKAEKYGGGALVVLSVLWLSVPGAVLGLAALWDGNRRLKQKSA